MMGYLYVLRCGEFFKIGWSQNPRARLKVAQTFNPYPVELVAYRPAREIEEREAHTRFSIHRLDNSEWFTAVAEIREWAEEMGRPKAGALSDWLKRNRGGQKLIAEALGCTPANISQWTKVPAEYAIRIETLTGLSRHDLRPDIFGDHPAASKQGEAA